MNRLFSQSALIATVVAIAVAAWMLSGTVETNSSHAPAGVGSTDRAAITPGTDEPADGREQTRLRVAVRTSRAERIAREVELSARTEPNRSVELRAETEGRVIELNAERGAIVRANQQIARLDVRDREARLAEANALIAQRRLQYEAAEKLRTQNLMSEAQIAETNAKLVSAQAMLAEIELEIAQTRIRAPFDAVVQERQSELGDFLRVGDVIAELVDINPLIVVGEVSEKDIYSLNTGAEGVARFGDGREAKGQIRYVAPVADSGTRTFRVELAIPNAELQFRAGITAELLLRTDDVLGHRVSPALLTLDDFGAIGVKVVDDSNRVKFMPVEILKSTAEGIWIAGLPAEVRIISVGQGFVTDGQVVEPVPSDLGMRGMD
jgi:multidrug efflux system membrane fusion protein